MRHFLSAIVFLLVLSSCGGARWSARDYALQATHAVLEVADYQQTRFGVGACREMNPVIGQCGGGIPINLLFPAAVLVNVLISNALSSEWRAAWQGVSVGVQADVVLTNIQNGVKPW